MKLPAGPHKSFTQYGDIADPLDRLEAVATNVEKNLGDGHEIQVGPNKWMHVPSSATRLFVEKTREFIREERRLRWPNK